MGLGFSLAKALLNEGFAVAVCARTTEALREAASALTELGPMLSVQGDISDDAFQTSFIDQIFRTFGRLDGLVNNASTLGYVPMPTLQRTSGTNLNRVFQTNTFAPILLLQKALPHLLSRDAGVVVGISSDAAIGGYPHWGVYGASKAALDLLHKTTAAELEQTAISVYSVDPGDMATAMHEAAIPGDTGLAEPDDVAKALLPLFTHLRDQLTLAFPSGCRLVVRHNELRAKEEP